MTGMPWGAIVRGRESERFRRVGLGVCLPTPFPVPPGTSQGHTPRVTIDATIDDHPPASSFSVFQKKTGASVTSRSVSEEDLSRESLILALDGICPNLAHA